MDNLTRPLPEQITCDRAPTDEERALLGLVWALGEGSYDRLRLLKDGTVIGIGRLLFTRAIYVDAHPWGFALRYCYDDRQLADQQFDQLQTGDCEPTGWIATRPERRA